jgi:uncharacterized protein YceK
MRTCSPGWLNLTAMRSDSGCSSAFTHGNTCVRHSRGRQASTFARQTRARTWWGCEERRVPWVDGPWRSS